MKTKYIFFSLFMLALSSSCKKENPFPKTPFVAAFKSVSSSFSQGETIKEIPIVYSIKATESGQIKIKISSEDLVEGKDYKILPEPIDGDLFLPIEKNTSHTSFTLEKLNEPNLGSNPHIILEIVEIENPNHKIQGNSKMIISLEESASLGTQINPEVGGPNEENQVYVDLASETSIAVPRDCWDLAFYSGDNDFRVKINGSLYMAVANLGTTDFSQVSESSVSSLKTSVAVGTFDPENMNFVDQPNGDISKTAIGYISEIDNENQVYLLNLGYAIGTGLPNAGNVEIAGNPRGWKKIRILRTGNDYLLQYANLDELQYQSVIIPKSSGYNFTFFSLINENIVSVEPPSSKWNICFSVFTNEIEGDGSYGYADFVFSNRLGGVEGYKIDGNQSEYNNFTLDDVMESKLEKDQRFIGESWRLGGGPGYSPSLKTNIFYVLKNPVGNYYKMRFTALVNQNGDRGYPSFEYSLLE